MSFFSRYCSMRVREFWSRSSLKGDPDQCRLAKYSLEGSKTLRQGNKTKPPHILFLNSHCLLTWSDLGLLGIGAWLQIRERKRRGGRRWFSSLTEVPVELACLLTQTESKQHSEPLLVSGVNLCQWKEQTWAQYTLLGEDKRQKPSRQS